MSPKQSNGKKTKPAPANRSRRPPKKIVASHNSLIAAPEPGIAEPSAQASGVNYRDLVELSPDMIVVHREGKIVYVNPAGTEFVGAADSGQLIGKSLLDLVHPGFRRTLATRLGPIYSGRERRSQIESRFVRLDGQVMDIEVSSVPITYEGKPARQVIARDISERKRAQDRLVYQSQLLASVHDAIIATDEHFAVSEWNRAAEQMYGWKAEEALGRNVNEVIPTEFTDAQRAEALRLLSDTGTYRVEVIQHRKDGTSIDVEGTTMGLRDAKGQISGYVSVNRDITRRRQAETALQEAESRLKAILSNAPVTIFATDNDGVFTLSDGKGLERVGLKPGENVGVSALDLYGSLPFVEHTGQGTTGRDVVRRALAGETVTAFTDLRGVHYENHIGPLRDEDGEVIGIVGVATDITEHRQAEDALRVSEERYRLIVENIDEIVYRVRLGNDPLAGKPDFVSSRVENILGYRPEEFLQDPGLWSRIVHHEDEPTLRQDTEKMLSTRESAIRMYRLKHKQTGEYRWMEDKVIPLFDDQGKMTAIQGGARDITERRKAEEERVGLYEQASTSRQRLQILSKQLIEAQEVERRRIARELHDEIGQVLTVVRTNLQTMQLAPGPSTLGPRLEESIGIVEHALRQVRDLSLDLRPSLLDDFGLAPALEWYVDREAQRSGFTAQFVVEPPEMQLTPALETACFRVAQAALTNVTRHAQAKRVGVELHRTETELRLVVRDDGIGFDVGSVLERAAQGASIGLLGMRERAQLAGGQIEIKSAPMHGTEILARFPLDVPLGKRSSGEA